MPNNLKGRFKVIYADPPWKYNDSANSGKRGAMHKYKVMTLRDIMRLPVEELAHPDGCILFMWHVPVMPEEALLVLKAWGFRFMNMKGFTWGKTYKKQTHKYALGMAI